MVEHLELGYVLQPEEKPQAKLRYEVRFLVFVVINWSRPEVSTLQINLFKVGFVSHLEGVVHLAEPPLYGVVARIKDDSDHGLSIAKALYIPLQHLLVGNSRFDCLGPQLFPVEQLASCVARVICRLLEDSRWLVPVQVGIVGLDQFAFLDEPFGVLSLFDSNTEFFVGSYQRGLIVNIYHIRYVDPQGR